MSCHIQFTATGFLRGEVLPLFGVVSISKEGHVNNKEQQRGFIIRMGMKTLIFFDETAQDLGA